MRRVTFFLFKWNLLFFFFFFASFVICEAVLTDWAFCSGNSTCEADANVHFFFLYPRVWCWRERAENVSSTSRAVFPDLSPVSWNQLLCSLPGAVFRVLHAANAAWLQRLLFRYGCRASSDGPASSIVCSQCSPVLPVMMSRLSYLKP